MRNWMFPKITFFLVPFFFSQQTITNNRSQIGANQQLVDVINDFASAMKLPALFIDERNNIPNNYLIQKEKEKFSIIPVNPITQGSYNQKHIEEEDKLYPGTSWKDNYVNEAERISSGYIRYCIQITKIDTHFF